MTANDHTALIERFYRAFASRDAAGMAACYHPEARFADPAFPDLRGADIGAMWAMLCARAQEFSLEFSGVQAEGDRGRAHWEPRYRFARTGRTALVPTFTGPAGMLLRSTSTPLR